MPNCGAFFHATSRQLMLETAVDVFWRQVCPGLSAAEHTYAPDNPDFFQRSIRPLACPPNRTRVRINALWDSTRYLGPSTSSIPAPLSRRAIGTSKGNYPTPNGVHILKERYTFDHFTLNRHAVYPASDIFAMAQTPRSLVGQPLIRGLRANSWPHCVSAPPSSYVWHRYQHINIFSAV